MSGRRQNKQNWKFGIIGIPNEMQRIKNLTEREFVAYLNARYDRSVKIIYFPDRKTTFEQNASAQLPPRSGSTSTKDVIGG